MKEALLASRLLGGFPHGFTTRRGGVSDAPFDSLNLGGRVGDEPERVAENWRRLEMETRLGFARVTQVHGSRVVRLDEPSQPLFEADAVLTVKPGLAATVAVADCVPVLIADPDSGAVAAVHAGWRGTLARAVREAVLAIHSETGTAPARLLAVVGPSIGPCCYEVSLDLAEKFELEFGAEVVRSSEGKPRVDLWAANRKALAEAGLKGERIELLARCTSCERTLFFSHRRDEGRTGRQVAFIAPKLPTPPS